jgi:hypothetical protein
MEYYRDLVILIPPLVVVIAALFLAKVLIKSARKRKGLALAFGMMTQMMLPDPQVEKTIETIISAKRNINEQEDQSDDKLP